MEAKIETHIALPQRMPIRLQQYGVGIFPTLFTKSALKKALKKKLISVDGKLGETSTFIYGNEVITFQPIEEKPKQRELFVKLEVMYEDDFLAIINKPAGIVVSGNTFRTVGNALKANLKKSGQVDAVNPQPAHRLDYATTGVLLVGKTSSALVELNRYFENRKIYKTYFAVALGSMKASGLIANSINGKKAISYYEVVATIPSERFQHLNLVKISPKTGRRHQLRKHLSEIGNPILGDKTYGKEGLILKGKGMYLHAFSLEFVHPFSKERLEIEKELPSKFKKLFP